MATSTQPQLTEQQVIEGYNRLRQEQHGIYSRITDAESERHEHALVRDTLQPLEKERRCHRLIGGVLVERSVGEVLPMITESLKNFDHLLETLNKALLQKDKELEEYMVKYKIRPVQQGGAPTPQPVESGKESKATGVLA